MAYTVFNIIGGNGTDGNATSDLNAGSTTLGTAAVTDAGGTYNQGTGAGGTDRYTASAGTPFSGTSVGEYISVYTAAAAATTFVGQITAVNGGGSSVDISLTIIYGTRPANASTKTAKTGGAWASFVAPATLSGTIPQSTEINIRGDSLASPGTQLTYTLASAMTSGMQGTATKLLWYRGYAVTAGDLDNGSTTLNYPLSSGGANSFTWNGAYSTICGISFTANRSGNGVNSNTNDNIAFRHCRFANTNSGSGAAAFVVQVIGTRFTSCYFTTPSTANNIVMSNSAVDFQGCYFAGAASGTTQAGFATSGGVTMDRCTFTGTASHGVNMTTGNTFVATNCTFNNCGVGGTGDAIHFAALPAVGVSSRIANCAFFGSGAYNINNASGTNTGVLELASNLSYNPATAHMNGFGDFIEMGAASAGVAAFVDGSDQRTSATDLHPKSTSNGYHAGLPQQWEGATSGLTSSPDVGAWQNVEGGGSASGPVGQCCQ